MSHKSNHVCQPSRPFRVIVGGTLATCGLLLGMVCMSHEYHLALLTQGEPLEISWETLVDQGYGDHPYIRLVDVDVVDLSVDPKEAEQAEPTLQSFDPRTAQLVDLIDERLFDDELVDARVVPAGTDRQSPPATVSIPRQRYLIDRAFQQIGDSRSLTGVVSNETHHGLIRQVIATISGRSAQPLSQKPDVVYQFTPVDAILDVDRAHKRFLLAGFALSVGLILCGSGRPGIWTWLVAPVPALVSLVGYPLRNGRGSKQTRLLYIAIGLVLMADGYNQLVLKGHFGTAIGDPVYHAFGFASLFTGLAAVLAVPIQITTRSFASMGGSKPERKSKQSRDGRRMTWEQACSMEPVAQIILYEDDVLVSAGSIPLIGELKERADVLEAAGFTPPESLQWQLETALMPATVQLGCQSMVVSEMELDGERDRLTVMLVSVLENGLPVITLSANAASEQRRPTAACLVQSAKSDDPKQMLSMHLAAVVGEAEKRDSGVVEVDPAEMTDVVHLARRHLAAITPPNDGSEIDVQAKPYGRFQYPPAPVQSACLQ
ncbi:hypothetical protein FYK55_21910 [Roseiconus nitratireducens]|uniref:Transmembrane protein n=1 Tax=Roseiconus nitratireducens TaxID=2605748 RepID=A0A5M6CYU6_9BACT|nr:hypothetical protein [Roseiconus nitratireducens]KAA5540283.1 hypothetical protein FYK55_21910 [Roseiconus nitratireducens]